MDQFPLGVEFDPTHEEVIRYLQRKLESKPVFQGTVCDFDVYSQHPKDLPGDCKFFFTPRHRASGNNVRRFVAIGGEQTAYWHTNDKINIYREPDEPEEKPVLVGQMAAFSFKIGNAGTDWLMHEYLLPEVPGRFQERAICKIRNKKEDRINAKKRKGKQMLEVPATSGYAGGSKVGNLASSYGEDVSDFDSRVCTSKRRKHTDELMIQKVTPRQVCEEFGFMPQENQLYLNNMPNMCNFTEASTSQLGYSCNQVMMPPPSEEVHEKSSLMRPFFEEFNQDLQSLTDKNQLYDFVDEEPYQSMRNLTTAQGEADSEIKHLKAASQVYNSVERCGPGYIGPLVSPLIIGDNSTVLQEEEDALQQGTIQDGLYQHLLEEVSDSGKDNPIALDDTDGGLWFAGNDDHNPINDEVNGDDDTQNDGGEMIQEDRVAVIAEDGEPSAVLSFLPQQQQIVHHSSAAETLPQQPIVTSSNDGSQLSTDDQFSINDLPVFIPALHLSTDDQFSIDDLPLFDLGLQFSSDDWETYNNGIPELPNLVAEDYSIW